MRTFLPLHFLVNSILEIACNNIYKFNVTKPGLPTSLTCFVVGYKLLRGQMKISVRDGRKFRAERMTEMSKLQVTI
jgi:hypothetical protein